MATAPTVAAMTAAHPEWADRLPAICTVNQLAVYSQHSVNHIREAITEHRLAAAQTATNGNWRIKREDALAWIEGKASPSLRRNRMHSV